MSLFSRFLGKFASGPQGRRGGFATMTKTPGHWQTLMGDETARAQSLTDPYNLSPWVSRAIKTIAGPIAQVELEFSDGNVEIEDPALTAFWNSPAKGLGRNGRLSRFDMIEATVGWLCLEGGFFWILDDTWLPHRAAIRSPFLIARPDKMRMILDDGELIGWVFTDAMGRQQRLIPDQVIHSRFWNPTDDMTGSAPMTAARQAAESDFAAGRFWKSLAEANGDLGDTVIAPNGISTEQEEQIKRALRTKRAAAKRGNFQPMFFVGDVKTEPAKIQSPDASAVTQRLQNRHEVFIAFGVPPSFAEVTNSYSIGSASDRFKLIEETCMPMAAKIAESVEAITERFMAGRKISVSFCFDDHSTMQQVRSERMEAGRKMHERGVPWSVINDHLKLKLTPFPGWDKAWLPFNLQMVTEPVIAEPVPAAEMPEAGKVFAELEELLKGCAAHPRAADVAPNAKWEKLMVSRAPYVKRVRTIIDKALFEARKETLANIAAAEKADKAIRSGAFDFIFDIGRFLDAIIGPVMNVMLDTYQASADELLEDELGIVEPMPADPLQIAHLKERENFIKDASTAIWEETRDSLEEGIQAGESYAKLSGRVREKFNDMSKERSMRIAVTETSIAAGQGRNDAMGRAGAKWKIWLTSEDDRVRLSHYSVNNKIMPADEPWIVGGAPMMYPCDPNGPVSEIINCRCVHGPVAGPNPSDIEGNNPSVPIPF